MASVSDRSSSARTLADSFASMQLGEVLFSLLESEQTGTLLIYRADEELYAAVRIEAGQPSAVLADDCGGEHNLATLLLPLFGWGDGRFEYIDGQDLVGEHAVLWGKVDPLPLITAAARACTRESWIAEAMERIERSLVQKSRKLDAPRYGFTNEERRVLQAIDLGMLELEDLRRHAEVPERVLRRVLYVLALTRAISLVPRQRAVSGTIRRSQRAPASSQPPVADASARPASPPSAPPAPKPSARPSQPNARPASQPNMKAAQPSSRPSQSNTKAAQPSGRPSQSNMKAAQPNARPASQSNMKAAQPSGRPSQPSARPSQPSQHAATSSLPPGNDRRVRREQSDGLWRRVDMFATRGDFGNALDAAHEAIKVFPPTPEQDAMLGWLMLQHAGGHESVHPQVWRCLDRALNRDPLCEQVLYYKGLVLNLTGDIEQAHAHFQRVLMIKHDHAGALREIRIYEMRKAHARTESSFLRRLLTGKPKGE